MRGEWLPFVLTRWAPHDIELLSSGGEPRKTLAYVHDKAPRPFELVSQESLVRFSGVLQGEDTHGPPLAVHWEPIAFTRRFGVSRTRWKVTVTTALPDDSVEASVRAGAVVNLQRLIGGTWDVYVGPSGQLSIEAPVPEDTGAKATVERLRRFLMWAAAAPLPREAVGKGARWEVRRVAPLAVAAESNQTATFTVNDLSDVGLDLEVAGRFTGDPQRPAAKVVIDEIEGDYAGRIVLLLDEATPVESELAFRAGMAVTEVAAEQGAPSDDERRRGSKVVWRARLLLQASALGPLRW